MTVAEPVRRALPEPDASSADVAALIVDVDHGLARHALEDVPVDAALLLTIEVILEVIETRPNSIERDALNAEAFGAFDDQLLIPVIRRGQTERAWSSAAPATALALSLRSLILGLKFVTVSRREETRATARAIRDLFLAAAANADAPLVRT